jgi:hypothetical protein
MQSLARGLPGIFDPTIFSGPVVLMASRFVRAPHPKTEIAPTAEAVGKILKAGWIGQRKVHGHRVQLHIPADPDDQILAFNRQGRLHTKELSPEIISEIRRVLAPKKGWNIVEGEWLKPKDLIYLFDFIKKDGELLNRRSYADRYRELPRDYLSPHLRTLPVFTTVERCMELLASEDPETEGLVFKSASPGFGDTTIIRCRTVRARRAQSAQRVR